MRAIGLPRYALLRMSCRPSPQRALHSTSCGSSSSSIPEVIVTQPDDWHLHLRDGEGLVSAAYHSAAVYRRAIIMPNLNPPVTTAKQALAYRERIVDSLPAETPFTPLMTCYLTDKTTPADVKAACEAGVIAYKLYPAGATTNSDSGVTDFASIFPALHAMSELGLVLCVHGEVTAPEVDIFDREREFIHRRLQPILEAVPDLRVVMEHITTRDAAEFVAAAASPRLAATITPQHIILNRNALFSKGLRPHVWCLPVLKREEHRQAVLDAATSGRDCFFLGTDSAPHPLEAKESACGCAGIFSAPVALPLYAQAFDDAGAIDKLDGFVGRHGPKFYRLDENPRRLRLTKESWTVPQSYKFGSSTVVPMWAGQEVRWRIRTFL